MQPSYRPFCRGWCQLRSIRRRQPFKKTISIAIGALWCSARHHLETHALLKREQERLHRRRNDIVEVELARLERRHFQHAMCVVGQETQAQRRRVALAERRLLVPPHRY